MTNTNQKQALEKFKEKNIKITSDKESLKEIASENNTSPKKLYEIIKIKGNRLQLPSDIPIGIAHKSIKRLSSEYQMDINKFIDYLAYYKIEVEPKKSFKRIAKENYLHPAKLYNMLQASQK